MSNPYSSQSISGYNASPPPDDGTQVTANQITWAKHKAKLADPIKTLAEAINSSVSTAFGKIFLNNSISKSSDYTVTSSDQGQLINVTNTTTINLPASGAVGPNFAIAIRNNGSGTVTIDGNSSETINGSVTQALAPGCAMILISDGNSWFGLSCVPDGVTATASEINESDRSAQAATDHLLALRTYIYNGTTTRSVFDADADITENTFESIGPTGSGATNIWTALDNMPSDAKAVIIAVNVEATASGAGDVFVAAYARPGDKTWTAGIGAQVASLQGTADAASEIFQNEAQAVVPLDTGDLTFDFTWVATGDATRSVTIRYIGCMA